MSENHTGDFFLTHTVLPPNMWVSNWAVSEVNGTSAQLGYTVPFTLVHAGKYVTGEIKNSRTTITKLNTWTHPDETKAGNVQNSSETNYTKTNNQTVNCKIHKTNSAQLYFADSF